MANSYLNIVTFLLTTLFYYLAIKPSFTYEISVNPQKYKEYTSNNYMYLAVYLLLVMVIQFIVNASIISTNCGGSITENMGAAGVFTFLPWTLIFGVLIVVLSVYPGFKSAFSDVVGYFWVAGSANKIITELLVNQDLEKVLNNPNGQGITADNIIDSSTPIVASAPSIVARAHSEEQILPSLKGGSKITKQQMQEAADLIIKICGNTSVLINQMVPSNFNSYWSLLKPLMKEKYQTENEETSKLRNDLFELVVTRDNVGESMWYMYTGLLLTSIVQLKITTRGCVSNPKTMEQNYQKFVESEKKAQGEKALATSTTYTITG